VSFTRTISTDLNTHLQGDLLTLAICVKLTREDGTVIAGTSHDRDLVVDAVTYEAAGAVAPSAMRQELGSGVDNLDILGLIESDRITETDLRAGLYQGARFLISVVNWADLTMGSVVLLSGTIGQITIQDGQYTAELVSLSKHLQQQIGRVTGATCDAPQFGAAPCAPGGVFADGATLAGDYTFGRVVDTVTSNQRFAMASDSKPTDYYTYGVIVGTSGANEDIRREIKRHVHVGTTADLQLMEEFPFDVEVGDGFDVIRGCRRRIEDCQERNNAINHQGFPKLTGVDEIMKIGRTES
jgi:uncharacterized phage protein (TIGR02218 family)